MIVVPQHHNTMFIPCGCHLHGGGGGGGIDGYCKAVRPSFPLLLLAFNAQPMDHIWSLPQCQNIGSWILLHICGIDGSDLACPTRASSTPYHGYGSKTSKNTGNLSRSN